MKTAILSKKKLNVLGIAVLIATLSISILSISASAASSSFSWAGALIDGRAHSAYHTLSTGTAYLDVTYHLGGDPTVYLCRNTSLIESWDEAYGSVYVPSTGKYTFPKQADANNSSYYLYVDGAGLYSEASGTLHN